MDYDVSTVFDRTNEIRCAKGVIDYKGKSVLVSNLCNGIYICNIAVRISQCFQENSPCVICDGTLDFLIIMGVNKCGCNSVLRKGVSQKIVGSAVNCLLCNNMTAVCCQSLNGIADSCSS